MKRPGAKEGGKRRVAGPVFGLGLKVSTLSTLQLGSTRICHRGLLDPFGEQVCTVGRVGCTHALAD